MTRYTIFYYKNHVDTNKTPHNNLFKYTEPILSHPKPKELEK